MNKLITLAITLLFMTAANAGDPRKTVDDLKARFLKLGEPRIEGLEKHGDISYPAIYFGRHKINNNFTIVDEIKKASGAYATIFIKDGNEFIRVSTNVQTSRGQRGTGTKLAHNAVYDSVINGQSFCGEADILVNSYYTCYDPIKDKSDKLIGLYLIGFKK